jgi:transposase
MVDSQVTEEIEVEKNDTPSSHIPSMNNENNNSRGTMDSPNDYLLEGAEVVIPYENYLRMGEGSPYDSEDELEEIEDDEDNTQYTPLSMDHREESKYSHRSVEVRRAAILCFKRGMKRKDIAKQFKVCERTVWRWKKEWKIEKKIRPTKPPGRPRILWDEPVKWMLDALKKNSSASNEMLAGVVHNMINPQSVSNYLKRCNYTEKRITDGGAQKMDDRIIQETREFYLKVKDIPWNKRVYMDESFVYNNEAPAYGRSAAGEPINRVRDKRGKRLTLYLAIRVDGLVHMPILKPENADDVEFMKYVEQTLVPHLRFGEVVIWDRLGRSGRCKNPCKQHYNPLARQMIEDKLCQLLILPPKGKYFDPIELVFSLLKHDVRKTYAESMAAAEQRPRTEVEIRDAVRSAALNITPSHLHGFYKERANGRSFRKVYPELVDKVFN